MNLVNLTPHMINVFTRNGIIDIPPLHADPKRAARILEPEAPSDQIELSDKQIRICEMERMFINLPEEMEDTIYIVSKVVAFEAAHQLGRTKDLVFPSELIYDKSGPQKGKVDFAMHLSRVKKE